MIRGRDNRQSHNHRPDRSQDSEEHVRAVLQHAECNEHGVAEMQGWHRGDRQLKLVMRPC